MTSRHRPDHDARERLATLVDRVRAAPPERVAALPDDQEWVNATLDVAAPEPAERPPRDSWWHQGRVGQLVDRWRPPDDDGPRRRTVTVVLVGGLVVAVLVAIAVTLSGPDPAKEAAPALPVAAAVTSSAPAGEPIVVSVVGRVAEPGLVTLEAGARVADALQAAGGPVPGADLGALNLARRLTDGEQLYVGVPPPPGADQATGSANGGQAGEDGQVDLNTASLAELDTLPGVGPVTAERIVDWRERNGRFTTVDQLREIEGIGPARYANLKDLVVAR